MKPVNVATVNEFHEWAYTALRAQGYMTLDVDAWSTLVTRKGTNEPAALYELKRSYIEAHHWRPYPDDRYQYAALDGLARAAGIPWYIVYFRKGEPIVDTTPLHVFRLDELEPYGGYRTLIAAVEFARRFPYPLPERPA